MRFEDYAGFTFELRSNGVLLMTISRAEKYNALDARMHWGLANVWRDVAADPRVKAVVVTGAGAAFCAGGDIAMERDAVNNYRHASAAMKEARDLVVNLIECDKPIISAINGVAAGAGIAVALLADISIIGEDTRITDGHTRIGLAAGDHAALIWPLLCGMAKAKYYLLTSAFITGREAERIGLVSLAVPDREVLTRALQIADELAEGSTDAIAWTKRSMNHWLRQALPVFESSLALEILGFFGPDVKEGLTAVQDKRRPKFPGAQPVPEVNVP